MYRDLESSNPINLKTATKLGSEVICLPIYPDLGENEIDFIVNQIVL